MKFMSAFKRSLLILCSLLAALSVSAQTKPQKLEQDDVIRVNTELVQTDVTVFDKKGHFVDGLKADQFALKVDRKSQPISFFERVTAASSREQRNATPTAGNLSADT